MNNIVQQFLIIFEQILLYLPLIFGGYLALSLMQIPNLSIESALLAGALTGAIMGKSCGAGACALAIGMILAAITAGLLGIAAALLHTYGKLSHLLSSIIIIGFMHGLSLMIMGASHVALDSNNNPLKLILALQAHPTLPILMIIAIIVSLSMYYFLKTAIGMTCAVYGDNPRFLISHKISTAYCLCIGLGIANGLAGISGYLIAFNNGFVDTGMGTGIPLLCITALMLGKLFFSNLKPINFYVPLAGSCCYFLIQTVLLFIGFDLRYFPLIQALSLSTIFLIQQKSNTSIIQGI